MPISSGLKFPRRSNFTFLKFIEFCFHLEGFYFTNLYKPENGKEFSMVTSHYFTKSLRQLFTFCAHMLCVVNILLAFLLLTSVKTNLICSPKEYLDLKNKLNELRIREKFLLERRTATYSTSSAEPSPPCTTPSSSGATSPIPSSRSSFTGSDHPFSPPLRAHIRVHLPNHQYTVVSIAYQQLLSRVPS